MLPFLIKVKHIFIPLIIVSIAASFTMFLTGCDGVVGISGIVYEWVNAPANAESKIYIDQQIPDNIELIPIEAARVSVGPKDTAHKGDKWLWSYEATSDNNGIFKNGGVEDPAKTNYLLIIKKDGYFDATTEFISPSDKKYVNQADNQVNFVIKAILVKK
jgi:hypothetical protein